MFTQSGIIPI